MVSSGQSPRSTLRRSIRDAYRARGRGNSNLWLVYSVKTNRDWLLPSDRQLVHWLYYLESNPEVASFDLAPEPIISIDDKESRGTELDAIVVYNDGHKEWHEVKAGDRSNPTHRSQLLAEAAAAHKEGVKFSVFSDQELRPIARTAIRWIKPLSYAAVLRGQQHTPCRVGLATYLSGNQTGTVETVLKELPHFDQAVVLGMMVRLAVKDNVLHFDLSRRSFGLQTAWKIHG